MARGSSFSGPLKNRVVSDITSGSARQWYSGMPFLNDPDYVSQFNDFVKADDYNTTNYTLTLVGSGTAAVATTTNEKNGALVLTTTGASSDSNSLQAKQEVWKLESGKQLWFEANIQASNVADVDLFIGLANTDTTPLDATDRIGFRMTNGAATLNYELSVGGVSTGTVATTGTSMQASTYKKLGFYWDGSSVVKMYVDRVLTNTVTANIPTAQLCLTAHIKTNSANARTAIIDYWYACKER